MTYAKATPRPWAWEWDSENNITIFQPSENLHCIEVAQVYCENYKAEGAKEQAEHDARLIVDSVNALVL